MAALYSSAGSVFRAGRLFGIGSGDGLERRLARVGKPDISQPSTQMDDFAVNQALGFFWSLFW